jgi:hypothetical protein
LLATPPQAQARLQLRACRATLPCAPQRQAVHTAVVKAAAAATRAARCDCREASAQRRAAAARPQGRAAATQALRNANAETQNAAHRRRDAASQRCVGVCFAIMSGAAAAAAAARACYWYPLPVPSQPQGMRVCRTRRQAGMQSSAADSLGLFGRCLAVLPLATRVLLLSANRHSRATSASDEAEMRRAQHPCGVSTRLLAAREGQVAVLDHVPDLALHGQHEQHQLSREGEAGT